LAKNWSHAPGPAFFKSFKNWENVSFIAHVPFWRVLFQVNAHVLEKTAQAGIGEPQMDDAAQVGLVPPRQVGGRRFVAPLSGQEKIREFGRGHVRFHSPGALKKATGQWQNAQ